jgi:hypothetical protein
MDSSNRTTSPIIRPLGAFEEIMWLLDQHRPLHFLLAAEVEGTTRIVDWRAALDRLQVRHPFLSVSIHKNGEVRPSFRHDQTAPIPLRVVEGTGVTERWESEAERELSIPFDPATAPLARAVLLHEKRRSTFLLVTHHSIADGRSVAFAIRDLLQALSGKPLERLPVLASHEDILGVTSQEIDNQEPDSEKASSGRSCSFIDEQNLRPHIRSLALTVELTEKLRDRARQEKTTVHGALSAAFSIACWETFDELRDAPIRVMSPIDTRKLLGLGEDCAFLVDATVVAIEPSEATTFWEIARLSTARLGKAQALDSIAASKRATYQMVQQGLDVPNAAGMLSQGFAHEVLLTNLGNLPYATDFGSLKLQGVWGPIVSTRFVNSHTIGVTTTNGALRLLHTTFAPAESLLQSVEEILITACATRKHVLVAEPTD